MTFTYFAYRAYFFAYSRYTPRIYHAYSKRQYIPGIYKVYTLNKEFLISWIYVQLNAVKAMVEDNPMLKQEMFRKA